jgi:hypothetical protein
MKTNEAKQAHSNYRVSLAARNIAVPALMQGVLWVEERRAAGRRLRAILGNANRFLIPPGNGSEAGSAASELVFSNVAMGPYNRLTVSSLY